MSSTGRILREIVLPLVSAFLIAALTMMIAQSQRQSVRNQVIQQTTLATSNLATTLQNEIDARLRAAELLGRRFAVVNAFDEGAFVYEATLTHQLFSDFQALNWIDADGVVRIVTPFRGNKAALGLHITRLPVPASTLSVATQSGLTSATPPIELAQGGRGFAAYSPVKGRAGPVGFVNSVFRLQPLIEGIVSQERLSEYAVTITDAGEVVFETSRATVDRDLTQYLDITVGRRVWQVAVTPDQALAARQGTWLDEIILAFGFFAAAVAAFLTRLVFRRQAALEKSEARLQEIATNINVAVWTTDVRFDRIQYANRALEMIFGLEPGEWADEAGHLARMLPDDDARRVIAAVENLGQSKFLIPRMEIQLQDNPVSKVVGSDGRLRDIYIRYIALEGSQGRVDRFLGLATDITALVEAQDQLRLTSERLAQSQKMEAIGQLTGGVAHDFNNLLFIILANAEILRDTIDDPDQREALDDIINAVVRGRDLNRDMLAFAGQSSLDPASCDLNDVIRDAKSWIRRALPESITLETILDDDLPAAIVDRKGLENAILNLVLNAKDAMNGQGTIRIITKMASGVMLDDTESIGAADEMPYVCIAVEDTGPGISKENQARIFEPFFTTKPIGAGTGLGLSMVQGFTKQSGGVLTVVSEVGKGARFELYLPAFETGVNQEG